VTTSQKKWTVKTGAGPEVEVEADELRLNETSARATFYADGEPVASFVGFQNIYPTPSA
jgi:hypothetical protein